jgi:hypothetical protein
LGDTGWWLKIRKGWNRWEWLLWCVRRHISWRRATTTRTVNDSRGNEKREEMDVRRSSSRWKEEVSEKQTTHGSIHTTHDRKSIWHVSLTVASSVSHSSSYSLFFPDSHPHIRHFFDWSECTHRWGWEETQRNDRRWCWMSISFKRNVIVDTLSKRGITLFDSEIKICTQLKGVKKKKNINICLSRLLKVSLSCTVKWR